MLFSIEVMEIMGCAFCLDRQIHHTDCTENQWKQLAYESPAFVARHAIIAALRSMSEARMNGAREIPRPC